MDAFRFDSLTRSLSLTGSRRHALSGLLFGSLGVFGARGDEAAAKKKCPPCKKRKKGKCKGKKPDGTACPGGTCHGGSCVAGPDRPQVLVLMSGSPRPFVRSGVGS